MKTESMHAGEFLLSEGAGNISREAINVAAGPALEPGQILGLVTASSEFAPYQPTAGDERPTQHRCHHDRARAHRHPVENTDAAPDAHRRRTRI